MNHRVDIKIVLLGKQNVGKTALMERFVNDRFLGKRYQTTIGAAFAAKEIVNGKRKVTVGIWDTAGTERYRAMAKMFYRDAKAAIVCYDLTDSDSWEELREWIRELRNHEENCKVYICGNKKDLIDEGVEERQVPYEKVSTYSNGIQVKMTETSSKTGENVGELFRLIVDDYLQNLNQSTVRNGRSLGVRRAYVNILVKIFEFGRKTIEAEGKWNIDNNKKPTEGNCPVQEKNGTTVISREDLILVPDPEQNYIGNNNLEVLAKTADTENTTRRPSFDGTLKHEFHLSDCLELVKAGVEAIIEDQVTSRFEAEELKVSYLICLFYYYIYKATIRE
ncbi:hypothetical protein O3M35_006000 [Rhynocoris fuscipes]|uniref:Ras-related protein Rab-24 n=1 Tax=Rhynocoris fuscipes TaxID=488301 RepID=A0AAW1DBN5_9HEMI